MSDVEQIALQIYIQMGSALDSREAVRKSFERAEVFVKFMKERNK